MSGLINGGIRVVGVVKKKRIKVEVERWQTGTKSSGFGMRFLFGGGVKKEIKFFW